MKIDKSIYEIFLKDVIERIRIARINASQAINYSAVQLNFEIGKEIVNRQDNYGWGKSIVVKLSKDLTEKPSTWFNMLGIFYVL